MTDGPPWTIVADWKPTRRKTAHTVVDAEGETQYVAVSITEAVEWLRERGHKWCLLETIQEEHFQLHLTPYTPWEPGCDKTLDLPSN